MNNMERYTLKKNSPCPKCGLGKGLREAYPLELGWTGWDNYDFLHCDVCGAYFCGKGTDMMYLKAQSFDIS